MTQISKAAQRLTLLGLSVTVLATASLTAPASAAVAISSPFCTNLSTNTAKITARLTDLRTKAVTAANARDKAIADRQTAWDQKIQDVHSKWDQKRTDNLDQLLAKAKDSAQRGAVQEYQRTITAAIQTRRDANDNIRIAYRDTVTQSLSENRTNLATDTDAFAQKLTAAKTAAEASCKATPAQGPAIRKTMTTALSDARKQFKSDRQDRVSAKFAISELVTTRNQAIKANDDAYIKTARTARDKLRTDTKNENL
jgi:hypothetical protein